MLNKRGMYKTLTVSMKILLIIPITILSGCLLSSCGSTPDVPEREAVINETFVEQRIDDLVSIDETSIPVNSAIPLATPVAGRPGFVFNPFNQNMVEVAGLRSGMKVRDPEDPDPSHIFVVP